MKNHAMKDAIKAILWAALLLALTLAVPAAGESLRAVTFSDEGLEAPAEGVAFENGILTISEPGEYLLAGTLTDGQIAVDCRRDGRVTLYLNGVSVHCGTSAALLVGECSPRLIVSLMAGSENSFSNGTSLVYTDGDEPNGAIFSDSDLTITGEGRLTVTAGAMDGIVSKDNLKIEGGEITVKAARHGIRGKDFVAISGGTLDITAARDGIKSTNKEDADRGYIAVTGGTVTIACGDEPFEAVNNCTIENARVVFNVDK